MSLPDGRAGAATEPTGPVHAVPDVLAFLLGDWRVERTVRDFAGAAAGGAAAGPVEGHFSGTTRFTPLDGTGPVRDAAGAGLLHHESGTFTWHGVARPAERTLRFLPGGRAGTVAVHFADGRFFHDLDLRSGRHTADHPCARDLYRGTFEVYDADHWRTRWRVAGPAKDLLLTTDCTRLP
ncbi:hypothetical protein GPA10_36975 [Streptomyces sp. p1417]|uniref:DUF6314 domain-containing protein n=1 Tax=Streptomyces typhae TaxID=2681492 RepID=A0A6L6X9P4_9ACTN|nr:DUF6314 family protein [Streptomyces typhae]MVO90200.1 hypothetical protein [Streptomyces typhae]